MDECLICLEVLDKNVCTLSCKHKFHFNCIQEYINKKNNLSNICCICEKRCEIINIENCENNILKKKNYICCNIL